MNVAAVLDLDTRDPESRSRRFRAVLLRGRKLGTAAVGMDIRT